MPAKGVTQTHCDRGHDLTEENSVYTTHGRQCRLCQRSNAQILKLRQRYGFQSLEEREALLVSQGNACAACGRTDCHWGRGWLNTWHVDHKPGAEGTHRGILCARCNIVVGILETTKEIVNKCAEYLAKWE